jgi:hypothetical protein
MSVKTGIALRMRGAKIKRLIACGLMALTLVGCGMGSVHPGQKARIGSLGFGCTELVDAKHAAAFLGAHESAEHMNAAFFLTDPPRCLKLYNDEVLAVTGEDGDYRQVHRQNGTDLWVAWQYLSIIGFK